MKNFLVGLVVGANWRTAVTIATVAIAAAIAGLAAGIEFIDGFLSALTK